jgi:hypothetical protein
LQAYLEQQIEEYDRVEQERMEERQMATKKILERMKIEQSNTIEGLLLLFFFKYSTLDLHTLYNE